MRERKREGGSEGEKERGRKLGREREREGEGFTLYTRIEYCIYVLQVRFTFGSHACHRTIE